MASDNETLSDWLAGRKRPGPTDAESLRALVDRYPCFAGGRALLLRLDAASASAAAAHAPSRAALRRFTLATGQAASSRRRAPSVAPASPDDLLRALEKDPTPTEADAPAPRHADLIDRFIQTNPRIGRRGKPFGSETAQKTDLANEHLPNDPAIVTETMANLFVKQGKTQQAIAIYQQLSLKYPDKSAYFADRISSLENQS